MSRVPSVVVLMTAGSRREGERIATALVDEHLAACVSVVASATSIYRWQGRIERGREVLLIAKTRRALVRRLTARVEELHSYDVPEVIALPIEGGGAAYLEWLAGETQPRRRRQRAPVRSRS